MTKDDFQKSAATTNKDDAASHQVKAAAVIKFQPKAQHISTPLPPMPKSPFGHIMPVAMNLKVLPTLVVATQKESKKDEE